MGRNKLTITRLRPSKRRSTYTKREKGVKKKGKELSILCDTPLFILLFNPYGKAELVLGPNTNFEDVVNRFVKASPKERYESKKEGIKALEKAFQKDKDHKIDVQELMHQGGYGIFDEVMQGQDKKFSELGNIEQLKILQIAFKTSIELIEKKKMEMSSLRERASASASASSVQHSTNQAAMNHPGPLNGNLMNQGTNLLQPNMNSGSNSDPLSGLLMAAPPEDIFSPLDEIINCDI